MGVSGRERDVSEGEEERVLSSLSSLERREGEPEEEKIIPAFLFSFLIFS